MSLPAKQAVLGMAVTAYSSASVLIQTFAQLDKYKDCYLMSFHAISYLIPPILREPGLSLPKMRSRHAAPRRQGAPKDALSQV